LYTFRPWYFNFGSINAITKYKFYLYIDNPLKKNPNHLWSFKAVNRIIIYKVKKYLMINATDIKMSTTSAHASTLQSENEGL